MTAATEERPSHPQRTRLAWRRTVLSAAVVGLLLVRLAVERRAAWVVPAAVAVWVVGALSAQFRVRALAAAHPTAAGPALSVAVGVTIGYIALGAAAVLLP